MSKILLVGGGPSRLLAHTVLADYIGATNDGIIACHNFGLKPTWVFLADSIAIARHRNMAANFSGDNGTQLIGTWRSGTEHCRMNGLTVTHVLKPERSVRGPHIPGTYCKPRFSGLMLLEWILNTQKPTQLVLAGYDGYGAGTVDCGYNTTLIQPFMQSCIERHPECQFQFVAPPLYQLSV